MYLFILESIGTQELMLIGLIALIVFGPRKLPEMARKLGSMMTEFRRVSSDFRSTWENAVALDETNEPKKIGEPVQNTAPFESATQKHQLEQKGQTEKEDIGAPEIRQVTEKEDVVLPEIRQVTEDEYQHLKNKKEMPPPEKTEWI